MKKLLLLIILVAGVIAFALPAQATLLTFDLNLEISDDDGIPPESSITPWLRAELDDGGTQGSVTLTLEAINLTGGEYVNNWFLNFDGDPNLLTIRHDSGIAATTVHQDPSNNEYKAGGDGLFDLLFDFPQANNPGDPPESRFGVGDTSEYSIEGSGITVESFNLSSDPKNPNNPKPGYFSAAHVGGIYDPSYKDKGQIVPDNTEGSGWIGDGDGGIPPLHVIPEPATMLLLGSGLIGFAVSGKKRLKKRKG